MTADFSTSQSPGQPSRQVTHNPEKEAGLTLFLVSVAGLAFGLLKDIFSHSLPFIFPRALYLLFFISVAKMMASATSRMVLR